MRFFKNHLRIPQRIGKLGIVLFFTSLALALIGSILSIYVNNFVNNESTVGFIFSFLVIISIISHLLVTNLIRSKNKSKMYFYSVLMIALGYFAYTLAQNVWVFLIIAIYLTIFNCLRLASSGLLIEHSSNKKDLSKNEGIIYTLYNLAWIIGPLLVGFILEKFGFNVIFLLGAFFMILSALMMKTLKINYSGVNKKIPNNILKNILEFFKDKNRIKIYLLSAGITFWWALIFVYIPLLIIKHLENYWVGFFLFGTIIPLVLLTYYFGNLAGKKGYKKIFTIGFFIPAIASLLCFIFFESLLFVLASLILASIGLAMTEGTTESYFFDILKDKDDQKFYSSYNTAIDFGGIAGEFIPAVVLLFLPFKFIFLIFALGMFALSIVSSTMRDVIESRRKGKFK